MSVRDRLGSLFKDREELDLTSGSIAEPLLYLSIPIVITNLLQTAYNLADTFWLGQYSTEALAAITFAFPMVFLLIALALGLSVAGSVLVAQHTGAGQPRRAEYAASQTIGFTVVVSAALGALGYFAVEDFLRILGAAPAVVPLATGYMQLISLGVPFIFGFAVFISLMRGYGDTVTPMLVMFGSVVLNIVLDPILIFGFESNPLFGYLGARGFEAALFDLTGYAGSGIEGAALATVTSRVLAFGVGLVILFRGDRGVQIHLDQLRPEREYARKLVDIGLPASIEGTSRAVSVNLMLFIIAAFPTTTVAAYGIGTRVFSVVFLPAIAFSQGVETMTGQNIGAGNPDRAGRTNHYGARLMLATLTALGCLIFVAAGPISSVFTTDPEVVALATDFLRITGPTFGFIGVMRSYSGGFRGASKTLVAAAIAIVTVAGVQLPVAWVAANAFGEVGLWASFAVSNVVGGVVAYLWFVRGTWRDADLTGSFDGAPTVEATGDD